MKKRLSNIFLVVCMMFTLLPESALAATDGPLIYVGNTQVTSANAAVCWETEL